MSILCPYSWVLTIQLTNSGDFAIYINTRTLHPDESLVSFDVVSLFTNVPVDLASRVAKQQLMEASLHDHTKLPPDEVMTLLVFCLNATHLAYQGTYFQQTFGTAMGSPVSVTVANLVMEDVEERALESYPTPPPFWKCCVDNTCTALPSDQIPTFISHLNSIEPNIQFTMEPEQDGELPFLDTLITHHPDGILFTTVYLKSHTDKYLHFQSHHPLAHKVAVIRTKGLDTVLNCECTGRRGEACIQSTEDEWLPS